MQKPLQRYEYIVDQRCGDGVYLDIKKETIEAAKQGRVDIIGQDMVVTLGTQDVEKVETVKKQSDGFSTTEVITISGFALLALITVIVFLVLRARAKKTK